MKCKECNNTSNHTSAKCWSKWGLCGDCAIKKHPEEYRGQIKARETFYHNEKLRYESCPECRELMKKTFYSNMGTRSLTVFYCPKCKLIKSNDKEVRFVYGK